MKKVLLFLVIFIPLVLIYNFVFLKPDNTAGGAPPYYVEEENPPSNIFDEYGWVKDWKRPMGRARVGLQVGHWKNEEVPEELKRLRGNTGASAAGVDEWEVNLSIAEETKKLLEEKGVVVDILPATVPQDYWADVFVAIHADGAEDLSKSGYKAAAPRRDLSGKADELISVVEEEYEKATGLEKDPNVTRNMKGYYAFSYWRYDNAVHPMTTSLILETGFLTNAADRRLIVNKPEVSAEGLTNGLIKFLEGQNLLTSNP